jgi:radical SAM protein with 4Fe4S-binding SPASM domain
MKNLKKKNIFFLSLDGFSSRKDMGLIYAPLAGVCTLATVAEARKLDEDLPLYPNCDSIDIFNELLSGSAEMTKENAVATADDFLQFYVLPSFKCNFACSYCFSANGRATEEISLENLLAALDFFVSRQRINTDRLSISYLGGGEPTLSWEIVRQGIEYADTLAAHQGIKIYHTIVTNGSMLNSDMARFLKEHDVLVRVSFEILPEIQALQRGQYDKVERGMQVLAQEGARHMVRSMITPDNVCLMEKMLEELHKKFPFVKNVLFDPITSSTTFSDKEITRKFYNLYIKHFLSARSLGKKLGIDVGNASLRNLDLIVDRYCAGEFCLTPDGAITICHQVSSPREKGYEDFIYGRVIDGRLTIDREKFLLLKSRYTVYDNPRCNDCDVKWTCGGGCTQQRRQYSDDILDIVCETERRLTTAFLLERIANGANINEMIETYGR